MAAPPPSATPIVPPPPGAAPLDAVQPAGRYDHERLKALWVQAGGDPGEADLMAHVALAESGGDPHAINAYQENGRTYHPRGLWQVSDIHPQGSTFDPLENARAAVALHRAQGLSPWEASRNEGGGGGWGRYLAAKPVPPPPGAVPLGGPPAQHAVAQRPAPAPPQDPLGGFLAELRRPFAGTASAAETRPAPPAGAVPAPQAGPAPAPAGPGQHPSAVPGQIMSGTTAALDYLGVAATPEIATARDLYYQHQQRAKLTGNARAQFDQHVQAHDHVAWPNSHALREQFAQHGFGPQSIHRAVENTTVTGPGPGAIGEHANPIAKVGLETAGQLLNPTNYIGPGAAKLIGGLARGAAAKTVVPIARAAENALAGSTTGQKLLAAGASAREAFAPFAGVRRSATRLGVDPDVAEQAARAFVNAPNTAKARGEHVVRTIFGGLTKEQRIEVERLSELDASGNHLNPPRLADPQGDLARRAVDLRAAYIDMTNDQRALDLLTDEHTFNPASYSYRGGDVYQKAALPPSVQSFFQDVRASFTPGGGRIVAGTTKKSKLYSHFDEAEPHLDLAKYDPADQLLAYMTQRASNVGRERAIRQLRDLGLLHDLDVIDPKTGVLFGSGKAGAQAAERVGTSRAEHGAFTDALDKLNAERAGRGEPALNPAQYAQMRRAVQSKGALRVKSQMSERMAGTLERVADRADTAAGKVGENAGAALLAGLTKRIADHDTLVQKIARAQETVKRGAGQADANSLAAMVAQRDRMALEIDALHDRVRAASRPFGTTPAESYYDTAARRGVSSPQAGAAFEHAQEAPQIVARLQGAYEAAQSLPPSAQRAQIVRALRSLSARAEVLPDQIADAAKAERLLGRVQSAMGVVAAAGKDESGMRAIAQMEQVAQALERRLGRDAGRLYGQRDAVAKPAERLADYVTAGSAKARAQAQAALDSYDFARASRADVAFFERAFSGAVRGRATRTTNAILDFSKQKAAERLGMGPLDSGLGSPTLEYAVAPKPLVRFFRNQGATEPQASAIGSWVDGMNRLARAGILYNPAIHAGWNLGTHFLAAGGPPEFFARRMWTDPAKWESGFSRALGRPVSGLEWQQLAEENQAIVHMANTHPLFGGSFAATYLDGPRAARSLADVGHSVNAALSQAQAMNARIVFDAFETRYSVALFQHFVENERLSPAAAGIAVRKALGDYTNISRSGIEHALTRTLMFYPWMKTAIPFWVKTLATRPQFVTIPGLGIRRWNQAQGDPDIGHESEWTIDRGVGPDGQRQKLTYPGPQKWVGDIMNVMLPARGDVDPLGARLDVAKKLANTHLRPFGVAGALVPVAETALEPARTPGGANVETVWDKREDVPHALGQAGAYAARKLPFAQDAAALAGTAQSIAQHNAGPLGAAAGGFAYERLPAAKQRQLNFAEADFTRAMRQAAAMKNPDARARRIELAREKHRRDVARITGSAAPPPGAIPR